MHGLVDSYGYSRVVQYVPPTLQLIRSGDKCLKVMTHENVRYQIRLQCYSRLSRPARLVLWREE